MPGQHQGPVRAGLAGAAWRRGPLLEPPALPAASAQCLMFMPGRPV